MKLFLVLLTTTNTEDVYSGFQNIFQMGGNKRGRKRMKEGENLRKV